MILATNDLPRKNFTFFPGSLLERALAGIITNSFTVKNYFSLETNSLYFSHCPTSIQDFSLTA